jgi:Uma2 family endonuclease
MSSNIITIKMESVHFSDDEFFAFCQDNKELNIERDEKLQIIIMTPTGSFSGSYNSEINYQIKVWNKEHKLGHVFDSSTGFTLPDNSVRSPDASWISKELWQSISDEEKHKFAPICPEFVIELRSKTDTLKSLQDKMQDVWLKNGVRLGWLIDPQNELCYVYEAGKTDVEKLDFSGKISGKEVLPNFVFDLSELRNL